MVRVERAAPAVRTPLHVWPWTRVLEFGTGRGLRTQRCVPQGGRIVAADPSQVTYRCEGACEGGGGACAGEWVAAIDLEEVIQRSYHDGVFTARNGLDRTEITCRSESAGFTQVAVSRQAINVPAVADGHRDRSLGGSWCEHDHRSAFARPR